ncbi:MAG: fumarylacetoacetate hydrolase family protein [Gammaproteobacteria bacterium]|nr:fumarylacetoacetate hydrolase family protein [Gammaproteobacteria bacterium]MBU1415478.1 fumarylacetoacetate hydrolase family protein [Gammaproteobacteria bacterium]
MNYAFEPAPLPAVLIRNDDRKFPVHRIYCVGRNYAAHAREMGATGREAPFFFMKPADAVVAIPPDTTGRIAWPPATVDLHHEVELVVAIGKDGANIDKARAHEHIWGYAIGLDLTRRDLQQAAKDKRHPWEAGKSFDQSAPVGPIHPVATTGLLARGAIWLDVDGQRRQSGDLADLIWSVEEIIAQLSALFELRRGDLIFAGTPEGVGPVNAGQCMDCGIEGLGQMAVCIA